MLQLKCPGCGGDLTVEDDGPLVICRFCDARSLLTGGALAKLGCFTLDAAISEEEARDRVTALLVGESRFAEPPTLTRTASNLRYLARRGRARVTPEGKDGHRWDQYESIRTGLFGVPLDDTVGAALLYVADTDALGETGAPVPDLTEELLAFEDRVERALADEAPGRIQQQGGIRYSFARFDTDVSFHDDVYVVDVPASTWSFHAPDLKAGWTTVWWDTRSDGRYHVVVNEHDGTLLRTVVPRQRLNFLLFLFVFIAALIVLPIVLSILGVIGMALLNVLMFLFMAVLGSL